MDTLLDKNSLNVLNKYTKHQLEKVNTTYGIYETVHTHYKCSLCKIKITLTDTVTYGCRLAIDDYHVGTYTELYRLINNRIILTCKEYQIKNILK